MKHKKNLLDLSLKELEEWFISKKAQKFRARQVFIWLYKKPFVSFEEMTDLPLSLRKELEKEFQIFLPKVLEVKKAKDSSRKYLLELEDGKTIETVLIPEALRNSLCISVQAGCKMGCRFCATAKAGFSRNLKTSEIIGQYLITKQDLGKKGKINTIVLMGMGEALDNLSEVKKAIEIFTSRIALGFSPRRITVSTAGVSDKIQEIWNLGVNLAVSINAPNQALRERLMPISKKYHLDNLIEEMRKLKFYQRQKLSVEYVLIKEINDSEKDAKELAKLLEGLNVRINLISFNAFPGSEFSAPDQNRVLQFQKLLREYGFQCFIRKSKGEEILAGCGQLSGIREQCSPISL